MTKYEPPTLNFFKVDEGETKSFVVLDPRVVPSKVEGFSPSLTVSLDDNEGQLTLTTVLKTYIEDMINRRFLRRGTRLTITNKGKEVNPATKKKNQYFSYDIEYE